MAALTLTTETYRDRVFGAWQGKSAGITLGAAQKGQKTPGRYNFYSPVPGQPAASVALDFPLVWLGVLEQAGPDVAPEDLAVAWLEHLDYSQDEFGYAALNLRRGVPPPVSGAYGNWFRHATGGVIRADFWALIAPGAPQVAAAYAYHDASLDHCEEGIWAAMFLAALGSAAFFLTDPLILLTIGLAMIPRTCRTARAVKTALTAAQRAASWLEARESVLNEVGHKNFTDAPQNMGFFTIGLMYGGDFGTALCAAANCGYDADVVGGALGAILGILRGRNALPEEWMRPIGDLIIPGLGLRDFEAPFTLTEVTERTTAVGQRTVAARCPDVQITDEIAAALALAPEPPAVSPEPGPESSGDPTPESSALPYPLSEPSLLSESSPLSAKPTAPPDSAQTPFAEAPADNAESTTAPESMDPKPTARESTAREPTAPGSTGPNPVASEHTAPILPMTAPEPMLLPEPAPAPTAPEPPSVPFVPQPVSRGEAALFTQQTAPDTLAASSVLMTPVAPDPVNAIAWTDNSHVKPLLVTSPIAQVGQAGPFGVVMEPGDSPTIAYNAPKTLTFSVVHHGETAFSGRVTLLAPPGWQILGPPNLGQRQYIAAHTGTFRGEFTLHATEGQARIDIANTIALRFAPDSGGPAFEATFLLLGASCWWTVGPFANFDGEGFDRSYLPEDRPGLGESYVNRLLQSTRWEKRTFPEPTLDLEALFKNSSGVCYGQTILRSPIGREARLVANTNSGVKVWLNGALVLRRYNRESFRPVLGSGPWAVDVNLQAGDNIVMVKWVRGIEPFEFSLTVSDRFGRGLPEVGNTTW